MSLRTVANKLVAGERVTLDELAVYWVKGDLISREQFFYDGDH